MQNERNGKSIVLCSDGTGNQDVKARGSNVFKLYEAVDLHLHRREPGRRQQIAYYDDGVGTEASLPRRVLGGAVGWGFCDNVCQLYTQLAHAYEPGDRLYLFGFSRGAYTVRALAGMIQYCGIVDLNQGGLLGKKDELDAHVKGCWKEFHDVAFTGEWDRKRAGRRAAEAGAASDPGRIDEATATRRRRMLAHAPESPLRIRMLGVWDTVSAVGMPVDELKILTDLVWKSRFRDLTVGAEVERACQALAIDDERRTFRPELWNEAQAREGQVEQVWFAGVHSNVGGGYSKHGMSLVALDWMMAEAEQQGLVFIPADREYARTHQDVHDKLYDSREGLALYYRWEPRDIAALCRKHEIASPKVHVSVFERIALGTEGYAPGNLPANLTVVGTRKSLRPTPEQLTAVRELVASRPGAGAGLSLLHSGEIRSMLALGKLSHWVFLGATAVALYFAVEEALPGDHGIMERIRMACGVVAEAVLAAWESPSAALKSLWPTWLDELPDSLLRTILSWPFIGALVFCYALAAIVDYVMERRFAGFWHACRARLRALL